MEYNIISDSCLDFNKEIFNEESFVTRVPFKVTIDDTEYTDTDNVVKNVLENINFKAKKIRTSCPSPHDFYEAIKDAKTAFIITISSGLSGSYQSALHAKEMIEDELKEKIRVHIFDSKSAATAQDLIAIKIRELIDQNESFVSIVDKTNSYIKKMKTIFSLESLDTLVSNGRVSVAKQYLTKAFKLFPILEDDGSGKISMRSFARGQKNALIKLVETVGDYGKDLSDRVLAITHINAPDKANIVKQEVMERYNFKDVIIFESGGLSTVYGSNQGIILSF